MKLRTLILNTLYILQIVRAVPLLLLYSLAPQRAVIDKDICRWLEVIGQTERKNHGHWHGLVFLVATFREFRSLFYYRVHPRSTEAISLNLLTRAFLMVMAKLVCKPQETLYILTPTIGPGLFIQHGFSTIISAASIGENCWINQQVTIGFSNDTDCPAICNNVQICAGAKVFGSITLGNNCVVGANAVVFKDVPPNCTVVGVPAYIVKCNGEKVKKSL